MSSETAAIHEWHRTAWSRVTSQWLTARMPHAMLLVGEPGSGALTFANALVRRLLCQVGTADGIACGRCANCRLMEAGSHPDYLELVPAEDHAQVRVDEVRTVVNFASLSASQNGAKVVLVPLAEELNTQAANCLLKTLEEPPPATYFLLCTRTPSRLLPTIRSRCQVLRLRDPDVSAALAWLVAQGIPATEAEARLELAQGLPLAAMLPEMASLPALRDALLGALDLQVQSPRPGHLWLQAFADEEHFSRAIDVLTRLVEDIQRAAAGASPGRLRNRACADALLRLAAQVGVMAAGEWVTACYASSRLALATGMKPAEILDALSLNMSEALRVEGG